MATIDKLLIRGIRSYSPESANVIELYTPLTLILGANGCGKTTIIECLKYATTGIMPPNSARGNAFINDPKLSNQTETKAQVKLKFRNVSGKVMICTRSLLLTQKAKTTTLKTMESILETNNERGEKMSISSRCAEMDIEIPVHLGVSRAVLENVIFVHQEESNWPLGEPRVLKEKFDDIFASSRWTKTVEELRSLKKKREDELKTFRVHLQRYEERRQRSIQLTASQQAYSEKVASHTARISTLQEEIDRISHRIDDLVKFVAEGRNLQTSLERETHQLSTVVQQIQDLRGQIYLFCDSDTDADLTQAISRMEKVYTKEKANQAVLHQRAHKLHQQKELLQNELSAKHAMLGAGQMQMDQYNCLCKKRQVLADEVVSKLGIPLPSSIDQMANVFESALHETERKMDGIRQKHAEDRAALISQITEMKHQHSGIKNRQSELRQKVDENSALLIEKRDSLDQATRAQSELAELAVQLEEARQNLELSTEKLKSLSEKNQQVDRRSELHQLQGKIKVLEDELTAVSCNAEYRAKMSVIESNLVSKQHVLDQSWTKLQETAIKYDLPIPNRDTVTPFELQGRMNSDLRTKNDLKKRAEETLRKLLREKDGVDAQVALMLKHKGDADKTIRILERELVDLPVSVSQASNLDQLKEEIERENANAKQLDSIGFVLDRFLRGTRETNECALCGHGIADEAHFARVTARVGSEVEHIPRLRAECLSRLEALEQQKTLLAQSLQVSKKLEDARKQLADLMDGPTGLNVLQSTAQTLVSKIDAEQTQVDTLRHDTNRLDILLNVVKDLCHAHKDRQNAADDAEQYQSGAPTTTHATRTLEDVHRDMTQLRLKRDSILEEVNAEEGRIRFAQTEMNRRQQAYNHINQRSLEKQGLIERLNVIRDGVHDLEASIAADRILVTELGTEMQQVNAACRELEAQFAQQATVAEQEVADKAKAVYATRQCVQSYLSVNNEIAVLERSDLGAKCNAVQREIAAIQDKSVAADNEMTQINEQLLAYATSESELDKQKRNIADNISYRRLVSERKAIEARKSELEQRMATHERQSYSSEYQRLHTSQSQLSRECHVLQGEKAQIENNINEIAEELQNDLCNAQKDWIEWRVKVRVNERSALDLEKYAKAVDSAIMEFHEMKMMELNIVIRELWVNTYCGTDIDAIEVRADKEMVGRRNFSYRVMMIKGDTRLEMRGRCSAGQKVLASIIIRLALAECFCISCGVFVLDEPTTNLDRLNMLALADSLSQILSHRSKQVNFQLVVITHDEQFLRILGQNKDCEYYWHVRKDEHQNSIIERVPMESR